MSLPSCGPLSEIAFCVALLVGIHKRGTHGGFSWACRAVGLLSRWGDEQPRWPQRQKHCSTALLSFPSLAEREGLGTDLVLRSFNFTRRTQTGALIKLRRMCSECTAVMVGLQATAKREMNFFFLSPKRSFSDLRNALVPRQDYSSLKCLDEEGKGHKATCYRMVCEPC